MSIKCLFSLDTQKFSQSKAPFSVSFSRKSKSWGADRGGLASEGIPHVEYLDGIPAIFIGRKSRNYLPAEYASFASVPCGWNEAGVRLEKTDMNFGAASLGVPSGKSELSLKLPPVKVIPFSDADGSGTGYLSVLYLFSVHLKGTGNVVLRMKNLNMGNETASRVFRLEKEWKRHCIALDGVFTTRELEAEIVMMPGSQCFIDGLMLEPYVVNYRSKDRALLFPSPASWVPGGMHRDADHLEICLTEAGIPESGMVDFWFRPTWNALHVQHCFFQMCHDYFGFEIGSAGPVFYAGQKACQWQYYWEWGLGQGYAANTWHHYALVWRKEGGATIYFDGQSRAHVEQVPAHALKPHAAGKRLSIGSAVDGMMCLDRNIPSEIDAYVASWRLHSGNASADDVLIAMEDSSPLRFDSALPEKMTFLSDNGRHLIEKAKDHCWFVHNLSFRNGVLRTGVTHGDDHHMNDTMRYFNTSPTADPSDPQNIRTWLESNDGGKTWTSDAPKRTVENGMLSDGRSLSFFWLLDPVSSESRMTLLNINGMEEQFTATFDFAEFGTDLRGPLCLHKTLNLQDGSFLLFASGIWNIDGDHSVIVFKSKDLHSWKAVARPYRPQCGIHFNETSAIQLESGRILIVMRTGGWNQMLAKGFSDDGGYTWTPAAPSGLCGIQPRIKLLKDGTVMLVTGRPGIIMALSSDGGENFSNIACAEDCRIHEFNTEFGWYGYSSMNNGMAVDEQNHKAYLSYDMLDVRTPDDGTGMNACYIREYDIVRFADYRNSVACVMSADSPGLVYSGRWDGSRVRVTDETGAFAEGEFNGKGLVGILEKSIHSGTVLIHIDGVFVREYPLYLPYRVVHRVLLADGLADGKHAFRLTLKSGIDPEHKFANPEMPALGGMQTAFLAGLNNQRRIALYGFEVLH